MNKTLEKAVSLINPKFNHVLEFGVWEGNTIKQLRDSLPKTFKIYGFDSFEGLPEDWVGTPCGKGFFTTGGKIPMIDGVEFFKGWFEDTVPQYKQIAKPISLLHVDCDLYSSTNTVLYGLREYIKPGTIIVFDEWYYNHVDVEENRQHEQKAFYEWVNHFNINYELLEEIEPERKIVIIKP
jgi:hypothetical protein